MSHPKCLQVDSPRMKKEINERNYDEIMIENSTAISIQIN